MQGRSSNRQSPTELQTYKVTKYGVRIHVLSRVPVGRVSREMTLELIYVALLLIIHTGSSGIARVERNKSATPEPGQEIEVYREGENPLVLC